MHKSKRTESEGSKGSWENENENENNQHNNNKKGEKEAGTGTEPTQRSRLTQRNGGMKRNQQHDGRHANFCILSATTTITTLTNRE